MTSREDLGRLAHAAYCDMIGRAEVWEALGPREQAGWMHVAVTVRDRLMLGMSHAYRPEDRAATPRGQEDNAMALAKSTAHGGSEEPTVRETDNADLYMREKAMGNTEVRWSGDGPAPDEAAEQQQTGGSPDGSPDGSPGGSSGEPPAAKRSRGSNAKR